MRRVRLPTFRVAVTCGVFIVVASACGASVRGATTTAKAPSTSQPTQPPATTGSATTPSSTPSSLPEVRTVSDVAGAVMTSTASEGYWLTIAGKFAWVANESVGLSRFDLNSGALVGTTPLAEDFCQGMELGFDSLWVANCKNPTVLRVSLVDGAVVARVAVPDGLVDEASIAVIDTGVWVLTKSSMLVRIDPGTNAIASKVDAPLGARALRGGFGSIWVTSANGDVFRLDPSSGAVMATISTKSGARFLAIGEGSVWVMSNDAATVTRIDPSTNAPTETIAVGSPPIDGGDIAVGGGYVWARVSDSLVAQIDPAANRVVARFGPASGSGSVGADNHALWFTIENQRVLWRVPLG